MKLIPIREQKRFNGKTPCGIAKVLKGNELSLYLMLLEYHNNTYNYAFPTYEDIRRYFNKGWDNKRIRSYLVGLEEKGFIVIGKRKKKVGYDNNTYTIFVPSFEEENKLLDELKIVEYEIDKIDNAITTYKNSLLHQKNTDIINYLKSEIKELDTNKKVLLCHQQDLIEKL